MNGISVSALIKAKPNLFGSVPVISGENGLNRMITNINVMEAPDGFNWVSKGDLLLTNFYSIKDNFSAQKELIPKLVQCWSCRNRHKNKTFSGYSP